LWQGRALSNRGHGHEERQRGGGRVTVNSFGDEWY